MTKVNGVDDLKQSLIDVWNLSIYGLRQGVIGDSNHRRRRRLRACIHDKMTLRAFKCDLRTQALD